MKQLLGRGALWFAAGLMVATPVFSGGVAVVEPLLSDNGDGDGFADTRETVTLRLKLQNTSGVALTGVTLSLTTDDYESICVTKQTLDVGDLLPGEIKDTTDGFEFVVADLDRTALGLNPYDELSVELEMTATADSPNIDPGIFPDRMWIDLDLDVSGGSDPGLYLESFEDGMGDFVVQNLDQGKASLPASDGYRCQYHDPDWVNSWTYGNQLYTDECYMAFNSQHADAIWWGVSGPETSPAGGRAFNGFHSLFYGIDMGPPLNWTSPIGTLGAVGTNQPIYLGWDGAAPELSIKHQAALLDGRSDLIEQLGGVPLDLGQSFDRGVVMVQIADDQDNPVGNWHKIYPHTNVYDRPGTNAFPNCMFDPIDDGSTEDMFYEPEDPDRYYGPSSTCFPELVFSGIGESSEPFNAENVGRADGPGLQGTWGLGTWIESRFDLSRFRGQRVRVRFLVSAMQVLTFEDWQIYLDWNPVPADNGWWIDDVTITPALGSPATLSVDVQNNGGLPGPPAHADPDVDAVCNASDNCPDDNNPDQADGDFDGFGTVCDCDDSNAATYPGANEINDGVDNQCPGEPGYGSVDEVSGNAGFLIENNKFRYSWPEQTGTTRYEVARAGLPDFSDCTAFLPTSETYIDDFEQPLEGQVFYYLVHSLLPNTGSWGQASGEQERVLPCGN